MFTNFVSILFKRAVGPKDLRSTGWAKGWGGSDTHITQPFAYKFNCDGFVGPFFFPDNVTSKSHHSFEGKVPFSCLRLVRYSGKMFQHCPLASGPPCIVIAVIFRTHILLNTIIWSSISARSRLISSYYMLNHLGRVFYAPSGSLNDDVFTPWKVKKLRRCVYTHRSMGYRPKD